MVLICCTVDFFHLMLFFSNLNIIVNNKKMTTAKQKLLSTESKLNTLLSQHNIDEIIRKKSIQICKTKEVEYHQ